jgi:sirohydrochlorin ferrochelatase
MATLDEWTDAVREALELDPIDTNLVLDLARDVAHGVTRPAAPLTAYLLGLAVGRGADPGQAAATITELARTWSSSPTG